MGIVKFNGISSDDIGLIVQTIPSYSFPEKEYDKVHIPGKNGDLIVNKGSYKNVEKKYAFAKVFKPGDRFVSSAEAIVAWLSSAEGYARLEDSYEPDYYRMAMFKDEGELNNYYDMATVLDVTFECKPQRWLISGEKEITVTSGDTITNPTKFDAMPIIKIKTIPNQNSIINLGDFILTVLSFNESKDIIIDCENMECYSGNTLYNSSLQLNTNDFPVLKKASTTTITYENITELKIIPRWWTL